MRQSSSVARSCSQESIIGQSRERSTKTSQFLCRRTPLLSMVASKAIAPLERGTTHKPTFRWTPKEATISSQKAAQTRLKRWQGALRRIAVLSSSWKGWSRSKTLKLKHSLLLPLLSLKPSAQSKSKSKYSSKSSSKLPRRSQSKSPQTRKPAHERNKTKMRPSPSRRLRYRRPIMNAQSQTTQL